MGQILRRYGPYPMSQAKLKTRPAQNEFSKNQREATSSNINHLETRRRGRKKTIRWSHELVRDLSRASGAHGTHSHRPTELMQSKTCKSMKSVGFVLFRKSAVSKYIKANCVKQNTEIQYICTIQMVSFFLLFVRCLECIYTSSAAQKPSTSIVPKTTV